jgi:hypothetical protein
VTVAREHVTQELHVPLGQHVPLSQLQNKVTESKALLPCLGHVTNQGPPLTITCVAGQGLREGVGCGDLGVRY